MKDGNGQPETDTRILPVELTLTHRNEMSQELGELVEERERLDFRFDQAKREHKRDVSPVNDRIAFIEKAFQSGVVSEEVTCRVNYDWTNGQIEIIRDDTGETVEVKEIPESMRLEHQQGTLGDDW